MDRKEDPVENAIKTIEFWIEKLEKVEQKLRGRIERENHSST